METRLASWVKDSADGATADRILRACVHCGFCLATCPTYQVLGDELDSPRGRIYQIKQVLEGAPATRETQVHLDRCLTCRSCETTCPSGVEYGHLVDIGRAAVDRQVQRPVGERLYRWLLREGVSRPRLFGLALQAARSVKWVLPASLRAKLVSRRPAGHWPHRQHHRKVLLARICAQTAMSPSIDAATVRVLDRLGIEAVVIPGAGCCGAIHQHLNDHAGARERIRRNIDAWWPRIESGGIEALIVNASGCGAMVKDYPHLLRDEPEYVRKAEHIVALLRDPIEFLTPQLVACALPPGTGPAGQPPGASTAPAHSGMRIAFHSPCTLQHGLKIRGDVEKLLLGLGAELVPVGESHLCCGSAGTYSLLQPELSQTLRTRKLAHLLEHRPQVVLSANIGCITHLQAGTDIPVRHWLEWLDEILPPA